MNSANTTKPERNEIVMRNVTELIPYARNARTHSDAQVAQIAASIREFGFTNPVLTHGNDVLAGHGRLLAARKLGMDVVPTIDLIHLTKTQARAYILADNQMALNAGWDSEMLGIELLELKEDGFDLDLLGFDDVAELLGEESEGGLLEGTDEDAVPDPPKVPITKPGDIITLGRHRLMCGDSTSIDAVQVLGGGQMFDMVFTDPPYGIDYQDVKKNHKKIAGDSELSNIHGLLAVLLGFNCPMFICCSWKCYSAFEKAMTDAGKPPKACIVWDKKSRVQNLDKFGKQHEFILYHGPFGGEPTVDVDVWECKRQVLAEHPTAKPVELIERAIQHMPGKSILDLFGGSGSTLIAAEKTGRIAYLMELDPIYCDVIVNRWEQATGKKAVRP